MQRIWITGPSGSGKTTLARYLGRKLNIPVYHRDSISWGENWAERTDEEQIAIIKNITLKEEWIYEGNRFTTSKIDGRFPASDTIIYIDINRFTCLYRGLIRYFKHRKNPRTELSQGCNEEYSFRLVINMLFKFNDKKSFREMLLSEAKAAGKKVVKLKGRKGVKKWCEEQDKSCRTL